ncbi:neuroglobin-like [Gigantopelta aegis]|uniref:neuroglobin-like n=1 Tax=Gigantopelta aegis TaxID=1735272 RepID=UPI001B8898F4|nr:neuroglobin-like [Gigantopelta aegis]
MDGIEFAVNCVDDLPKLNKFLLMLGKHHQQYGVPIKVLEKLWSSLDYSFDKHLQPETYNRDARKAWTSFFSHIISVMKTAMNNTV